jgi:hypothetical protein
MRTPRFTITYQAHNLESQPTTLLQIKSRMSASAVLHLTVLETKCSLEFGDCAKYVCGHCVLL